VMCRRSRASLSVCRQNAIRAYTDRRHAIDCDWRSGGGNGDSATKAPSVSPSSRLQLPHQSSDVDQAPCLNRSTILDAPNAETFDSHVFARRLDPKKSAAMRAFGQPVIDDEIVLRDGVQTAHGLIEGRP